MDRRAIERVIEQIIHKCKFDFDSDECDVRPASHWNMPHCYYGRLPKGLLVLPPGIKEWIKNLGYIAQASERANRIIITPLVYVEAPRICFHATPWGNRESILRDGLKIGRLAGRSTTKWMDAADYLHVCFSKNDCQRWFNEVFVPEDIGADSWWAIFEIDILGLECKVFRDPSSSTGYIIDATHIPPDRLTCRFGWD